MGTAGDTMIKDYTLLRNRQNPDLCYAYVKREADRKYSIFTMDGGQTFLASIEETWIDGRWHPEFDETCGSIEECLAAFEQFNSY